METRILGKGIRIETGDVEHPLRGRAFVRFEHDGREERWVSASYGTTLSAGDEDPTSELLDFAVSCEALYANLLAELGMSGFQVARWDFFAAPTTVELSPELRTLLRHRWRRVPQFREPSNG